MKGGATLIGPRDIAKILRGMRDDYSPWTQTAVYRIVVAVFSFAEKRGVIVKSPVNGLTDAEKPSNATRRRSTCSMMPRSSGDEPLDLGVIEDVDLRLVALRGLLGVGESVDR